MGVAQMRRRIVLIAWNTGKEIDINLPVVDGGTLRTAIEDVKDLPNHDLKPLAPGTDLYRIAERIKPGQKLSNVRNGPRAIHTWDIPEVFGRITLRERRLLELLIHVRRQERIRTVGDADPVRRKVLATRMGHPVDALLSSLIQKGYIRQIGQRFDLNETFNGKFRRLHWDRPSLTVDTRFGNPSYFLHPRENRGFTAREAARIQGFPDAFRFLGSEVSQFRLIGNAVPPPLAKCLATTILNLLD
jgi:DNA (cytosine-5)-methyltransferase 1